MSRVVYLLALSSLFACSSERAAPEFGSALKEEVNADAFRVLATRDNKMRTPRDLEFNPWTGDLWVLNRANDTTIVFEDPKNGESIRIKDSVANHFQEEVSSMAFGAEFDTEGSWASCQESRNTYDDQAPPNDFMGPALWPSDLDYYGKDLQGTPADGGTLGSHIDMLHASPNCMGIAWHGKNKYWVFDGANGHVVYYDFARDHGYGWDDHDDGVVRRFPEAEVTRVNNVPGHMHVDPDTGWLYVADTGAGRVFRLDTRSGEMVRPLQAFNEPLAEYSEWGGASVEVVTTDVDTPAGLTIANGRLFVGDYATGEILAIDLATLEEVDRIKTPATGLMGIEVSPEGELYYVDGNADELVVIQ